MNAWLLDVNVLIALLDAQHGQADRARAWFHNDPGRHWLSCPLTQNGVTRIMSGIGYSAPKPIPDIVERLRVLTAYGKHRFLPDDISLLDETIFSFARLRSSKQITDAYLLALAAHHGAALATFDTKIVTDAVRVPDAELFLIP